MEFNKILCPVDFSEISRDSLKKAVGLAKQYGARLIVAHVVSGAPWLAPPMPTMSASLVQFQDEIRESAQEALRELVSDLVPEQLENEVILETGDPSSVITKIADENEVDLIVMASREDTAFGRFLFGSVAEKVLRSAGCPILVLKEKD